MSRVAIIGSGIAGLSAAYRLALCHDVVVFECAARGGGHSRTVSLPQAGINVDTGFIVYNEANYPLLTRLFRELEIATETSNMSFGVMGGRDGIEYAGTSLNGLFAQRRNLLSPNHWQMLRDTLRFFRLARSVLDASDDPSVEEFTTQLKLGRAFRDRFLVPMAAAIWSSPPGYVLDMPAKTLVRFFANHNLLQATGHRIWRTVTGGSQVYVGTLAVRLGQRLRTNRGVEQVERRADGGHDVISAGGHREAFDAVVLACHADTALSLVDEPTSDEREVLGAFTFRDNQAVLHGDVGLMPRSKAAWASWIYDAGGPSGGDHQMSVTYWMNNLQNLPGPPLFVTLNPNREIASATIYDRHTFRHPVFTKAAIDAQERIPAVQGRRGLWFCGAWQRHGFHEDGIWSAMRVADAIGAGQPWL